MNAIKASKTFTISVDSKSVSSATYHLAAGRGEAACSTMATGRLRTLGIELSNFCLGVEHAVAYTILSRFISDQSLCTSSWL